MDWSDLNKSNLLLALVVLLFIAAMLAGIYPAVFNSKFNPIELLKGRKGIKGTNYFARGLLVIQFSLSVIVFIAGIVFTQNAAYQKVLGLGYDKQNILTVSVPGDKEYEQFKNKISESGEIEGIAGTVNHIGPYTARHSTVKIDTTLFQTNVYEVGTGYFNVMGLHLISGRDFIEGNQTDYESGAIIDENFALNHGMTNPIDAQVFYEDKPYRVIGIVKNHLSGLKQKDDSEHLFTLTQPSNYKMMVVRTRSKKYLMYVLIWKDNGRLYFLKNLLKVNYRKTLFMKKRMHTTVTLKQSSHYPVGLPFIGFWYLCIGQLKRSEKNQGNRNTKGIRRERWNDYSIA